jgi:transposase-like protein
MVVSLGGRRMYLWRAVDREGEVRDMLIRSRRNKAAALHRHNGKRK